MDGNKLQCFVTYLSRYDLTGRERQFVARIKEYFISMPENPRLLSLGMNGILSKRSQVEPGEAEQIPT